MTPKLIFRVIAIVLFVLAAFGVSYGSLNFVDWGLASLTASFLSE